MGSGIKLIRHVFALVLVLPEVVLAQAGSPPMKSRDPAVAAMWQEWQVIASNISRSAELLPDSSYKFRPAASVMSFGELLAHVSMAQYSLCANSMRIPTPADSASPGGATKADLRKHFDASVAFCQQAYRQDLASMSDRPSDQSFRYFVLAHNTAHANEHYGNMVTYLRILGFVPPSSAR